MCLCLLTVLNHIFQQQLNNEDEVRETVRCHHASPKNAQEMAENIYGQELTQLSIPKKCGRWP